MRKLTLLWVRLLAGLTVVCAAVAQDEDRPSSVDVNLAELRPGECHRLSWSGLAHYVCIKAGSENSARHALEDISADRNINLVRSLEKTQLIHGAEVANAYFAMELYLGSLPRRSLRSDLLVLTAHGWPQGCIVSSNFTDPDEAGNPQLTGFSDPCSGRSYDALGLQISGALQSSEYHLFVPPYRFVSDSVIRIGELPDQAGRFNFDFAPDFQEEILGINERLRLAVRWGRIEVVWQLLAAGADPNYRGVNDTTTLHLPISRNDKQVLALLVMMGADVNARNAEGWSVLNGAMWFHSPDSIEFILRNGAKPALHCMNSKCSVDPLSGMLSIMPLRKETAQMVELLLEHGADPTAEFEGLSPVDRAREAGDQEVLNLLLDRIGGQSDH